MLTVFVSINPGNKTEKPKFLKKPSDLTVTEQEDAVFETEVVAHPEPAVEW